MGRRRSNLRLVSIKIDENSLVLMDLLSKQTGRSRSELIRLAVHEYLKKNMPNPTPRVRIVEE
jgi:metal-responsive CopG/Arc/MetJ family transcriptional regulator